MSAKTRGRKVKVWGRIRPTANFAHDNLELMADKKVMFIDFHLLQLSNSKTCEKMLHKLQHTEITHTRTCGPITGSDSSRVHSQMKQ